MEEINKKAKTISKILTTVFMTAVIACVGLFSALFSTACNTSTTAVFSEDQVLVFINQEYTHLLEDEELDFGWENIESIYYSKIEITRMFILHHTEIITNEKTQELLALGFISSVDARQGFLRLCVNEAYNDRFDSEGFSLDDFESIQATNLEYRHYYKRSHNEIVITLKNPGQQQMNQAIGHFRTLPFVRGARPHILDYSGKTPDFTFDSINVVLTKEYSEFDSPIVSIDDFSHSNIGSVIYISAHPDRYVNHAFNVERFKYIVSIHLIEPGEQNVLQAIDHISKLSFIESAEPNYIGSFGI